VSFPCGGLSGWAGRFELRLSPCCRRGAGATEKLGRVRTCRLEPVGFSVAEKWIAERRSVWEKRLDRLGDLLAEDDEA
jgi:hypothetical protein